MSEPTSAPAIGYSIVSNLGGDRQMTVQCFVAEDEDDAVIHGKIDRIFRVVDRQKARYELVDIHADLEKHRDTLAQFQEDLANVEHNFNKKQAALDVQIEELQRQHTEISDQAYNDYNRSGRGGGFKPVGHTKANLERLEAGVKTIEADKQRESNERDQHREGVMISIQRFEKAIAALEAKITDREALLKGD